MGPFDSNPLVFRKQFFRLFGAGFRAYDASGNLVLYCKQKAFKMKEDIRVFADEAETREILNIQARRIIDISATYDVFDSATQQKIGSLRRKGLASILRDTWEFLDANDQPVGKIEEDSQFMALIRRFLMSLIPQSFTYTWGSQTAATFAQAFNPFVFKGTLDVTGPIDKRLAVAATVLLLAIEGRQN